MDGRVEPAAVNGFHTGKPVEIGDHKDDTDRPEEIHNLRQRSEVILLLAHNKMCLGLELGAVSAFLLRCIRRRNSSSSGLNDCPGWNRSRPGNVKS